MLIGKKLELLKDKNLISFYKLYCEDCPIYREKIADLARELSKELKQLSDKTAEALSVISFFKVFSNYHQCYGVLGVMVKLHCRKRYIY